MTNTNKAILNAVETFTSNKDLIQKLSVLDDSSTSDFQFEVNKTLMVYSVDLMDMIHTDDLTVIMKKTHAKMDIDADVVEALNKRLAERSNDKVTNRLNPYALEVLLRIPSSEEAAIGLLLFPILRGDCSQATIDSVTKVADKEMIRVWNTLSNGAFGQEVTQADKELVYI